jgi:hypothetical protein
MKTRLLKKLRKYWFKRIKIEKQIDGVYRIRAKYNAKWYERIVSYDLYLCTNGSYSCDGRNITLEGVCSAYETDDLEEAKEKLYQERRRFVHDKVREMKWNKNKKDVETENKQLQKI